MGMANRAEIARRLVDGGPAAGHPGGGGRVGHHAGAAGGPHHPGRPGRRSTWARPPSSWWGRWPALDLALGRRRPLAGRTVVVDPSAGAGRGLTAAALDGGRGPGPGAAGDRDRRAGRRRGRRLPAGGRRGAAATTWVAFTSANAVERFVPLFRDLRDLGRRAAGGGRPRPPPRPWPGTTSWPTWCRADEPAARRGWWRRSPSARRRRPGAVPRAPPAPPHPARRPARQGVGGGRGGGLPDRRRAPRRRHRWRRAVGSADVVTFASPSAVDAYLALGRRPGARCRCRRWWPASGPRPPAAARRGRAGGGGRGGRALARGAGGGARRRARRPGRGAGGRRHAVGWSAWAFPSAGCAGSAAPRPCAGWWPRPGSASTTSWPRSSCARGSTSRCRSLAARASSSTRWPRWWPRPSGWPSLGRPGAGALRGARGQGRRRARGLGPRRHRPAWPWPSCARRSGDELVLIADLCLDEYTDHGHCGVLRGRRHGRQRRHPGALRARWRWPRRPPAPTWWPRAG